MKRIFKPLFALAVVFAGVVACEDNDEEFSLDTNSSGELVIAPESASFEVTEDNLDEQAERFAWNDIEFSLPTAVTYRVELDTVGGNFSNPQSLAETSGTNASITFGQINDAVLALGGINDVEANYLVRVAGYTADAGVDPVASEPITVSVEPFEGYPYEILYLVGAATAPGWDNGSGNGQVNPPLYPAIDATTNTYYYSGYFNGDAFKILSDLGNWQPQYGVRNGAVGVNDGNGSDPDVFSVPADGYYDMVIDITGVTNDSEGSSSFSITANSNAASAPTYSSMGLIGPATPNGWDGPDMNFTQSSFDPHKWEMRNVSLLSGEMKIRADDDWTNSWGDDENAFVGKGENSGDPNITAQQGTYDIFFNDLDGRFVIVPLED